MSVPFLDVRAGYRELQAELDAAVARVMAGGQYVLGDEVEAFEREFADYLGVAACVGVGNGLDALVLALEALEIGAGDEVLVPAHTFIATWLAVSAVGATPVPVDVDPATFNIDPEQIEAAISPRSRAIIPVHLYGQPADLGAVLAVAARHGLKVIEDAAQAHGARLGGERIGGRGDLVTWSFYPAKNLGAFGDGGAVSTNDPDLARKVRELGNYGSLDKYEHPARGRNSRLDPIQAALLRVKLATLDEWNDRRLHVAERYLEGLALSDVTLPNVPAGVEPVWHLFVVRHPDRAGLHARLASADIATLIHYPTPPHLQGAYADLGLEVGTFPEAERACREVLSLPMGPHLGDDSVDEVIRALR